MHIGPYRVERELGRGGMGVVYLASRDDNTYFKQVAIKLLQAHLLQEEALRRFRSERQILASLEHPNIARLIDGGTTEQGEPYLVMEYVRDAKSLRRYAVDAQLSTRDRLLLFLTVCRAVQHAHRHLVIHRDLKPSNILVTPGGEVKLVDFGIAKLLLPSFWPNEAPETRTGMQAMTPEYASPEQIRGENISVASDVYTLGVVLYELLTGELPFRRRDDAHLLSLVKEVLEKEPPKPSGVSTADVKLSRELNGDLDNIILMSLRKEPEKRYESVEQLGADIQRYLDGLPVKARSSTFRYRAYKFATRNRTAIAAAALVIASLVGGIVATSRQAAIADRERAVAQTEAAEARRQRARAETLARMEQESRARAEAKALEAAAQAKLADERFDSVRELTTKVVFELELEIRRLPGAIRARRLLMDRTRKYLDQLYETSRDHPGLQSELASAYIELARLQRSMSEGNLGDAKGAAQSLGRGISLARASMRVDPSVLNNYASLSQGLVSQADLLVLEGKPEAGVPLLEEALRVARAGARRGDTVSDQRLLLQPLNRLADSYLRGRKVAEADTLLREAMQITERNLAEDPDDPQFLRDRYVSLDRYAVYRMNENDTATAKEIIKQIPALLDAMDGGGPKLAVRRERMTYIALVGRIAEREGDHALAVRQFRQQVEICEAVLQREPKNYMVIHDTSMALKQLGENLSALKQHAEAMQALRRAVALAESLLSIDPTSTQTYAARLETRRELADALSQAKDEAAEAAYRELAQFILRTPPAQGDRRIVRIAADSLADTGDYFLERASLRGETTASYYRKAAEFYQALQREKEAQEMMALAAKALGASPVAASNP